MWQVTNDNELRTFERVSKCDWKETLNGKPISNYAFVKFNQTFGLVLFDSTRKNYISIQNKKLSVGKNLENLAELFDGDWSDKKRREETDFRSLDDCQFFDKEILCNCLYKLATITLTV